MSRPVNTDDPGASQSYDALRMRRHNKSRYELGLCARCPAKRDGEHRNCCACRLEIKIKRIRSNEAKAKGVPPCA